MSNTYVKAWISGKVQGVWYRRSTQDKAVSLGVTGYAINLADGRVEVLMCGAPAQVEALSEWLWLGPEKAQVTGVELELLEIGALDGVVPDTFTVG